MVHPSSDFGSQIVFVVVVVVDKPRSANENEMRRFLSPSYNENAKKKNPDL